MATGRRSFPASPSIRAAGTPMRRSTSGCGRPRGSSCSRPTTRIPTRTSTNTCRSRRRSRRLTRSPTSRLRIACGTSRATLALSSQGTIRRFSRDSLRRGLESPRFSRAPERLRAIAHRVEHRRRDTETRVALVTRALRFERIRLREGGQFIEVRESGVDRLVHLWHRAPDVPREHLDPIERRQVANDLGRDEPQPAQIADENAIVARIGLPRSAEIPSVAGDDEAIVRDVERIEVELEPGAPYVIELRVYQNPPRFFGIPVFADDMLLGVRRIEVRAEALAIAGGDAV